jgi:hypothetical protein
MGARCTMLPFLWVQLTAGFVSYPSGWAPSGMVRRPLVFAVPCGPGVRSAGALPTLPGQRARARILLQATAVDDEATKDAKLQALLTSFKAKQANGVGSGDSAAIKSDLQAAVLRALGEADELLEARGREDLTRKETKLHVLEDIDVDGSVRTDPEVLRALREADKLLDQADELLPKKKGTETLTLRRDEDAAPGVEKEKKSSLTLLREAEQEQRATFAAKMRKCKNKVEVKKLLDKVESAGLEVDTSMANAALEVLAVRAQSLRTRTAQGSKSAGDAVELAKGILARLRQHSQQQHGLHNEMVFKANGVTYSSYIALLSRAAAAGAIAVCDLSSNSEPPTPNPKPPTS